MKNENLNPFILPSVLFQDRNSLPEISAIYFVSSCEDILYIGQSVNLYNRFCFSNHHRHYEFLYSPETKISYLACPDHNQLDALEEFYIELFKPRLNNVKIVRFGDEVGRRYKMIRIRSREAQYIEKVAEYYQERFSDALYRVINYHRDMFITAQKNN